jgi:3-oxoacyl-[acyl-carrier protein] reductase
VTGASKGIGAGIAKELAAAGAAVVVNYASDRIGAESVVDAIVAAGGRAAAIQADVSKAADVTRLFENEGDLRIARYSGQQCWSLSGNACHRTD